MLLVPSEEYLPQQNNELSNQNNNNKTGLANFANELDRQIQEILYNQNIKNDDEKVKKYLIALRRYLITKSELDEIQPVPVKIITEGEDGNYSMAEDIDRSMQKPSQKELKTIDDRKINYGKRQINKENESSPSKKKLVAKRRKGTDIWQPEIGPKYTILSILHTIPENKRNEARLILQKIEENLNLKWNTNTGELITKNKALTKSNIVDNLNYFLKTPHAMTALPVGHKKFKAAVEAPLTDELSSKRSMRSAANLFKF